MWATNTGKQVNNLFAGLRTEAERIFREIQERIEGMRADSTTERNSELKATEDERVSYKTAHEEHMRCLNMERDARMREITEIRADISKMLANNRNVEGENHSQLGSLIELERKSRQDLLETERISRARDLQDLKITLTRQFDDAHNAEKLAREAQFEWLLRDVAACVNRSVTSLSTTRSLLSSKPRLLAHS